MIPNVMKDISVIGPLLGALEGEQPQDEKEHVEEGLKSIASSKLADLARGFFLKARPIIVLHHPARDKTVSIKLKRGLLRHTLEVESGGRTSTIAKGTSALIILTRALNAARQFIGQGYIEI